MGGRQYKAFKPAKSLAELEARRRDEAKCTSNPFSLMYFLRNFLGQAIWCKSRQKVVELRVDAQKLQQLKREITQHLDTNKTEWVSTYESLVAALIISM